MMTMRRAATALFIPHHGNAVAPRAAAIFSLSPSPTSSMLSMLPSSIHEAPSLRYHTMSSNVRQASPTQASRGMTMMATPFSSLAAYNTATSSDEPKQPAFFVRHPPLDNRASGAINNDETRSFAVVSFAGSQFKITVDDILTVSTTVEADVGEHLKLSDVLLIGGAGSTVVGRPFVPGAYVSLIVEEKKKEKKVIVFKKRRRKGYQRKNGFRRQVTVLRVKDINF